MNEKDYQMLNYIYQEKNISNAAKLLFTSQPSLSYRLKQIENELGIKILIRSVNSIEFTPEGEYLVAFAKEMLKNLNSFRDGLYDISSNHRGNLRIAVTNITARYYLPNILKKYTNKYPNVSIYVSTGKSPHVLDLLETNNIHVGIIRGDHNWNGAKKLIDNEEICIVSNKPINLEDLPQLPQVYRQENNNPTITNNEHSFSSQIQNWWFERFTEPPKYTIEVGGFESCKEMVRIGLGYAFIPKLFINETDNLYVKKLKFKNGKTLSRNTWLLYRDTYLQLDFFKRFICEFD
ncbi:LysR family transcriptional regulator [Oceanobacillus jeddahense]|uniref:LysR family transcriptional regulator n=1 Tax=Oceanobacillus jeddahense TaxID=1462527 RepID=UPI000595FCC9|nr:LysR family transcriptional regulator [Oceanobacillus jeddahense]